MRRSSALRAAKAITAASLLALMGTSVQAAPTYCMREGWYFADRQTGGNRADPQWSYYASLFFDYNDCNGENACNDTTITCIDPPV